MNKDNQLVCERLTVSPEPPYDPLQAFVRDNHIALEGSGHGPLQGLVFAAKDVFKIKGSTYGNGHPTWLVTNEPDDFTSSAIVKLLDAGADLVGKTVCDELCYSISGENWHYGSPIHPFDARRFVGGSSSGTGAATAGGLVDFAIGSDCLGSVRVPASYTGLYGIRPTYQRVSNDGEAPYCESMDVLGYVAKEPDVFLKVSEILLGEDPIKTTFKRLWIAKDCFNIVDTDYQNTLNPVVNWLKENFQQTEDVIVAPEGLEEWVNVFRYVQGYEVWESYGGWVNKYKPQISRGVSDRLKWASTISKRQYEEAKAKRQMIIEYFDKRLDDDTILCLPTVSSIAPLRTATFEEINKVRSESSQLLCISPLTGTPQVTLPLGEFEGLPYGLTFISKSGTDLALVKLALELSKSYLNE